MMKAWTPRTKAEKKEIRDLMRPKKKGKVRR